jgi:hypothetical protein
MTDFPTTERVFSAVDFEHLDDWAARLHGELMATYLRRFRGRLCEITWAVQEASGPSSPTQATGLLTPVGPALSSEAPTGSWAFETSDAGDLLVLHPDDIVQMALHEPPGA